MKKIFLFLIVFSVVLVSRLPFLDAGYGMEQDGWRVAATARTFALTGEYKASRFPGFPVVEFICSLVWNHGALAMNFLTALASAVTAGMLSIIAKRYGSRDSILLALTFAFTPVVFINSTVTMDYLWAMMFVSLAWYAGLNSKPMIAGLLLGIAIGCRITTVVLVLPFTFLFLEQRNWRSQLLNIMRFWFAAGFAGVLTFLPVFFAYGTYFITGYKRGGLPSYMNIIRFITNDVWGLLGSLAIASAVFLMFRNYKKKIDPSILQSVSLDHRKMWFSVLVIYAVSYVLHPMKGAYVIPAIPFLLLIFALYLTRNQLYATCALIILSSFIVSIEIIDLPWSASPSAFSTVIHLDERTTAIDMRGAIFSDHVKRIHCMNYINTVIAQADTISQPSVIMAGSWIPYLVLATPGAMPESEHLEYSIRRKKVEFIDMATEEMLNQYHHGGLHLLYLPRVNERSKLVTGIDLKNEGAREFTLDQM